MSDNGPQISSGPSAPRFGRPGTPTDQAWIETLFGHVKTEWPHLEKITDPNTLRAELNVARRVGYVTPDDEHPRGDTTTGPGLTRIAYHRNNNQNQP